MKARRLLPGIAIALMGLMLAWGGVRTLHAQDTDDSTGNSKPAGAMPNVSSRSSMKGSIFDKLGGNSAIDALTDRFLADVMGTSPNGMNNTPGSSSGTVGQTGGSGMDTSGTMNNPGTSTGMGSTKNMGGWDYTALREHVRTRLCKAAGGDCKIVKMTKSEMKNQPKVSEGDWDKAVSDIQQALSSYTLTQSDQNKLVAAVNGMKKEFVSGSGDMGKMPGSKSSGY